MDLDPRPSARLDVSNTTAHVPRVAVEQPAIRVELQPREIQDAAHHVGQGALVQFSGLVIGDHVVGVDSANLAGGPCLHEEMGHHIARLALVKGAIMWKRKAYPAPAWPQPVLMLLNARWCRRRSIPP